MSLPPEIQDLIQEYRELSFRIKKGDIIVTKQDQYEPDDRTDSKFTVKSGLWCITQTPWERKQSVLISTLLLYHPSIDISQLPPMEIPFYSASVPFPILMFLDDITIFENDKCLISINPVNPPPELKCDCSHVHRIGVSSLAHVNDKCIAFFLAYQGDVTKYGLFAGMVFLLSGKFPMTQDVISDVLVGNGGLLSNSAACVGVTHVIASTIKSNKCTKATEKGIPIMTWEWIRDCIRADRILYDDIYRLDIHSGMKRKPRLVIG